MGSRDYLDVFRDPSRDRCSGGGVVSATYRIDLRYDPHSSRYPWDAVVTRLSDDKRMTIEVGSTSERAIDKAREFVRTEEQRVYQIHEPLSFYVDDQGRDAEAPQSVKVP